MKILWLTWKDLENPQAGGAELVNERLAKRLAAVGHRTIFLTAGFPGSKSEEEKDGYKIIRRGNRWSVYGEARKYYLKNLARWPDLVIEEINTAPFKAHKYAKQKVLLVVYQLCREIWFKQMFFPLNVMGYLAEPLYLRRLNKLPVITISESTRRDLTSYGFSPERIKIMPMASDIAPLSDLQKIQKAEKPTILSLGAIRPMKRTDHIVKAFALARRRVPGLRLIIAGDASSSYGRKVIRIISHSPYREDIVLKGQVDPEQKRKLLLQAHLLAVTSVKEGWGLVVTEANSQGTPAVVYNVNGLRDAVRHDQTGLVTGKNTPQSLADSLVSLLEDRDKYKRLQNRAWQWSQSLNWDRTAQEFNEYLEHF